MTKLTAAEPTVLGQLSQWGVYHDIPDIYS
jgi:hypothetical protein